MSSGDLSRVGTNIRSIRELLPLDEKHWPRYVHEHVPIFREYILQFPDGERISELIRMVNSPDPLERKFPQMMMVGFPCERYSRAIRGLLEPEIDREAPVYGPYWFSGWDARYIDDAAEVVRFWSTSQNNEVIIGLVGCISANCLSGMQETIERMARACTFAEAKSVASDFSRKYATGEWRKGFPSERMLWLEIDIFEEKDRVEIDEPNISGERSP